MDVFGDLYVNITEKQQKRQHLYLSTLDGRGLAKNHQDNANEQFKVTFGQNMNGSDKQSPTKCQRNKESFITFSGSPDPPGKQTGEDAQAAQSEAALRGEGILHRQEFKYNLYKFEDCPNDLNIDFMIVSPPKKIRHAFIDTTKISPRDGSTALSQGLRPNPVYFSKEQILVEELMRENMLEAEGP